MTTVYLTVRVDYDEKRVTIHDVRDEISAGLADLGADKNATVDADIIDEGDSSPLED